MTAALNLPLTRSTGGSLPAPTSVWPARIGRGSVAVGALAAGIGLWYAVTYLVLSPSRRFLLPAPHTVLTESLLDPVHLQPMLTALGVTAKVAAIGFLLAALIGVAVGALMSQAWWLERAIFPYAVVLQVVPILAITPLLGLWFGYSTMSRVAVCVMIALFPIITNTHFGFRSVDPGLHELFTLGRASRLQRLVRLELPAALPSILTGLRIASGQVIIGAIIGDMFFAQGRPGIGTLMDNFRAQLRSTDLIAAIALAAALGVIVFVACSAVSRLAVGRWHTSGGAR
ncbi:MULTISPECIES: ABC transporter permease [unclassified Mycobacterium]|uniref:ABC transporter permease n=1 Tax=unclassified Mycobacterium TaxID=2642494 RepID=UPI00048BA0D8|nr:MULTISPECIES: ABC transporter permease [unclassified Mycobacterium]SEB14204.1 NitT/TauT family transport system permease protein [Mycobacterium sp. 283mftsu]